jgi:hypothetical protein
MMALARRNRRAAAIDTAIATAIHSAASAIATIVTAPALTIDLLGPTHVRVHTLGNVGC